MPTRVDRVKLLVMTNPQGVLISPHPHFCPWDKPLVLAPVARIGIARLLPLESLVSFSRLPGWQDFSVFLQSDSRKTRSWNDRVTSSDAPEIFPLKTL